MKWYREETGELVGDYTANCLPGAYGGACVCPLCGAETTEWFGQIDEIAMLDYLLGY